MRSRYAAYALGLADYIIDTTDRKSRIYERDLKAWKAGILAFSASTQFMGLETRPITASETDAVVQFKATLRQHGQDASFTETSRFVNRNGRWLYCGGEVS